MNAVKLSLLRFCPVNKWKVDTEGEKWYTNTKGEKRAVRLDKNCIEEPMYVEDMWTGDKYLNEGKWKIRGLCGLAALATPVFHPAFAVVNIVYRIIKLVSFHEFWREPDQNPFGKNLHIPYKTEISLKYRSWQYTKDLLRVTASPLAVPMLEISAIYGMIMPYDGRKLYATTEGAFYGSPMLGQCFEPTPTRHLFGGDIKTKGAM